MREIRLFPESEALLRAMRIESAWHFHVAFNPSKSIPYHNATHVNLMLLDLSRMLAREDSPLSWIEAVQLAVAAIFHDFGHSGGAKPDPENIEIALSGFRRYCLLERTLAGRMISEEPISIIRATEFPYQSANLKDPRIQAMRDLDLMTIFHFLSPETADQALSQIEGLRLESFPTLERNDFCEISRRFLQTASWHTPYGQTQASRLEEALALLPQRLSLSAPVA